MYTADSAYRHTERQDAQRYLTLTCTMLSQVPESIPNSDRADEVLEMNSERMTGTVDEGEVVLHSVNNFVLNDDLVLLSTE